MTGPPSALRYVGLGFEMVLPVLLGVFGGLWLDRHFGSEPWCLLAGAVLGIGAGFFNFYRAVTGLRSDRGAR